MTSSQVSQRVLKQVRDDILQLRLAPGARLVVEEIADVLSVSGAPVRRALTALEVEGLVESTHNKGARVASLSVEYLELIQSIRSGLECRLARLGAENMTDAGLTVLTERLEAIKGILDTGQHRDVLDAFWSFRLALYTQAHRPILLEAACEWRLRYERYLMLLVPRQDYGYHLSVVTDVHAACCARDGAQAEAVTARSVEWALDRLSEELRTNPRFSRVVEAGPRTD